MADAIKALALSRTIPKNLVDKRLLDKAKSKIKDLEKQANRNERRLMLAQARIDIDHSMLTKALSLIPAKSSSGNKNKLPIMIKKIIKKKFEV